MAQIPWKTILTIIEDAIKQTFDRRNEPQYWWANFKPEDGSHETVAKVKNVRMEATTGLRLELEKGDATIVLEARPSSLSKSKIYVGGKLDVDASMVFDVKNQSRFAFDFKNVTIDGEDYRIDTRLDP